MCVCVYGKPPHPVDSEDQCVLCVCVETSLSYFLSEGGAVVNDGVTVGLHTIHNTLCVGRTEVPLPSVEFRIVNLNYSNKGKATLFM